MNKLVRVFLLVIGTISVALGILGMFLPVLPTTPFLLLAAVCYARSSERFYNWLLYNKWFGAYIRNYLDGKGIPLREKVLTLVALWLTILFTSTFIVSVWWARLVLVAIAAAVTIHLAKTKTYRRETAPSADTGAATADTHKADGLTVPDQF